MLRGTRRGGAAENEAADGMPGHAEEMPLREVRQANPFTVPQKKNVSAVQPPQSA